MTHELEHFLAEAELRVSHLSPDERREWAEHCHRTHPGFVDGETAELMNSHAEAEQIAQPLVPAIYKPEDRVFLLWVWRVIVVILLLLIAAELRAQDNAAPPPPAPDIPKVVTAEDRESFKDLRLEGAFTAIAVVQAQAKREQAEKVVAQAQLDEFHQQQKLDEINARIAKLDTAIREKSDAPADKWCLTPVFAWSPKGEKPCPVFSK